VTSLAQVSAFALGHVLSILSGALAIAFVVLAAVSWRRMRRRSIGLVRARDADDVEAARRVVDDTRLPLNALMLVVALAVLVGVTASVYQLVA
jgi:hypothetical protein